MSEVATIEKHQIAASQWEQAEFIKTIQETVCKGATPAQFKMFAEVCKATGLNPFLKEIWFVPNVGVMAGRDGYLRIANEHPMFDGMETKVERDEQGIPIKATCSVWRKDRHHPITCEAYYNEYKKASQVWSTYKSAMIAKVAEVLALKRSFSINGVVTEEEIGRQDNEPERGTRDAQKEVASRKIHELTAPEPTDAERKEALGIVDYEQRHAAKVSQASEALKAEPKPERKRGTVSFEGLKLIRARKDDLRTATGSDEAYYSVLRIAKVDHADELDSEPARTVSKALAKILTAKRQEAELTNTLTEYAEQLGVERFTAILGANGCVTVTEAMQLGGTPLSALLDDLKQAAADRVTA